MSGVGGPEPFSFRRGDLLDARFEVLEPIGRGGMARVYRAIDRQTGQRVALKVLRPELAAAPGAMARIEREATILRRLAHPAVVALIASGRLPMGGVYLVMELLDGHTLGQWMRRRKRMQPGELAPTLAAVCAGLHAAHCEGIVHRDLKPDNIFLCALDGQVKLLDFGVSKLFGGDALTRPGEVLGTPRYMAPEQLRSGVQVSYRADIYALGVIVYEALAGRPPFLAANAAAVMQAVLTGEPAPLHSLRPDLPRVLSDVVMRALSFEPEARFATAAEFGDALLSVIPGAQASAPGGTAPLGKWPTPALPARVLSETLSELPELQFSQGRGSTLPAEPPSWMPPEPMRVSPVPDPPRSAAVPSHAGGPTDEPVRLPISELPRWWLPAVVALLTAAAAILWWLIMA